MKTCTKCGETKTLDDFSNDKYRADGKCHWCRECCKSQSKLYRLKNPQRQTKYDEQHKKENKNSYLIRKYGITLYEYGELLQSQEGVCAGCGQLPNKDISLAVDHDHVTGHIRGLLCDRCNKVLGSIKDDPKTLRTLADYIESAPKGINLYGLLNQMKGV